MYWCDGCSLWQHERCLITAIEKGVMKTYFESRKEDYEVIIINDEDRGDVTATLRRNNKGPDESFSVETREASVPVMCLKCGKPLR